MTKRGRIEIRNCKLLLEHFTANNYFFAREQALPLAQYTKDVNTPIFVHELKTVYHSNQKIKDPSKIAALNSNSWIVYT